MDNELLQSYQDAVWIAKTLFQKGTVTGSAANISFRCGDSVYISQSGSIFGLLSEKSFAQVDLNGQPVNGGRPSKELPMHLTLYREFPSVKAVIHTHSFYSTIWSTLPFVNPADAIPEDTPYLKMQLGAIRLVGYHKPGSEELFEAFRKALGNTTGYLLKNHGPIVGGSSLLDAFAKIEELETSAKVAWHLHRDGNFTAGPDGR